MLSTRLKKMRSSTPYTQAQLADTLGVARTTYAMYEQGKREPDHETLNKIADYFNVSTDYLLGRTDIPDRTNEPTLKGWLRSENEDLSENERKELEKDIQGYLAHRRERILENRKNNK